MTEKIECDGCRKLTDKRYLRLEVREIELDWRLAIPRGDLDFCSLTCLESWLEHKKRHVTKISEKIPGKPETVRFVASEGIEVKEEDLEEGGEYVKKEVWKKLMKGK